MLSEAVSQVPDMSKFVGVIGVTIGWLSFIIVLSILKSFITRGISIAVTELLLRNDNATVEKVARWFSNGDDIMQTLKEIQEKMGTVKRSKS